jgi:HK97 gp10 family phage protein
MTAPLTVELNMKEAIKIVEKMDKDTIPFLRLALKQAAFIIEAEAVKRAPVDQGTLRASIHVRKVSDDYYVVEDGVEYGVYQEYGTTRMRAQPFMRPALLASEATIQKLMADAVNKAIKA